MLNITRALAPGVYECCKVARSICTEMILWNLQCWWTLPGQLCAWAGLQWGTVNGHGYDGQQQQQKNYLWWSWTVPNDSNQFFTNFDWLVTFTQVVQMPRCQDLVIFVVTTDRQQTNLITMLLWKLCMSCKMVCAACGHLSTLKVACII